MWFVGKACLWAQLQEHRLQFSNGRRVEATPLVEVSIERTEPDRVGCSLGTDDVFVACRDYVAAKGMRVYAVPHASDSFIVSGESGAVTPGTLMFLTEFLQYTELWAPEYRWPDSLEGSA